MRYDIAKKKKSLNPENLSDTFILFYAILAPHSTTVSADVFLFILETLNKDFNGNINLLMSIY